jgi:hypothetical protein
MRMGREVFLVRDGAVVWSGRVGAGVRGEVVSARECFEEAWWRAVKDGAVNEADAGIVEFRSYKPDMASLRRVGLRAMRR